MGPIPYSLIERLPHIGLRRAECFLKKLKKSFKDTHREKALSNKIPARSKSMNMNIWLVGTSNQLFILGS